MALCWPTFLHRVLLMMLFACSSGIDASFSLSNELTDFIPACAQTCFVSFLENNFGTIRCGTTPTLDCLCSSDSASGFTAGEGAIQCIISEFNVGGCNGQEASGAVIDNAFSMCDGQTDALPNTHKTITATFVVQSSNPSVVVIANPTPTTSSYTTSCFAATSTQSITSPRTMSSSTTSLLVDSSTLAISTTSSRTSRIATNTSPPALSDASSSPSPTPTPTLSKKQVIGISAASVGVAAIIAGLIVFCACLRRRRQPRDSDMLPFQKDPETPISGLRKPPLRGGQSEFSKSKSSNGASPDGTWTRIPTPQPNVPPRLEISDPYMFSRRSIKQNTIGVAISPDRSAPISKRTSRLLPAKPTLKLATNQAAELPPGSGAGASVVSPSLPIYAQMTRESTATQFEEDEDATPSDNTVCRKSTDQTMSPQTAFEPTIKVFPPTGIPTSFFVTSNYPQDPNPSPPAILMRPNDGPYPPSSNFSTTPDYYIKPLTINRDAGSLSRPRPSPKPGMEMPSQNTSQNSENGRFTQVSSMYSGASATPYTNAPSTGPLSSNFPLSIPSPRRSELRNNRKSISQVGPYDRVSVDSYATSFADSDLSQDSETGPGVRGTMMMDLSPVVESPASGRSPVSYPKIPPSTRTQPTPTIRMVPPPPQPDFTSIFSSGTPRNTLLRKPRNSQSNQPWQVAEITAARQHRLSQQQQPSQEQARQNTYGLQPIPKNPPPKLASPFKPQPKAPPSAQIQTRTGLPQPSSCPRAPSYIAPSAHFNNSTTTSSQAKILHLRTPSNSGSIASQHSTNSSLLAKRLGVEKAAALHLRGEDNARQAKWRVLDEEERERARDPGWRPQLAIRGERERRTDVQLRTPERLEELPRTPGWMPKLTPTRRGDELFLSVA
ncbi:hypothetical protein BJ878DRAFT_476356 [Calycina marina]|uniref:Extracellular membrane protein CFEM domain-containing protein n=1 Tax=Calycina marina TaxID=1763456 RepID=A0A9P7ZAY6_9HELO|nr:hypothetical protein BJ878DRAFT_476356 [Calycina marina]